MYSKLGVNKLKASEISSKVRSELWISKLLDSPGAWRYQTSLMATSMDNNLLIHLEFVNYLMQIHHIF